MLDAFDEVLGLSLKSEQLGFSHMASRAALMYVALIILVRFAKKRFLGGATAFDYIPCCSRRDRAMTGSLVFFRCLAWPS